MTPILTLTLNPALDISTSVAEVVAGPKLRCAPPVVDPGGGCFVVGEQQVPLRPEPLGQRGGREPDPIGHRRERQPRRADLGHDGGDGLEDRPIADRPRPAGSHGAHRNTLTS